MSTGASDAQRTFAALSEALAANPTAGAWRAALEAAREAASALVTGPSLAEVLAWDDSAFAAERQAMRREFTTLVQLYNSISELEDAETVGEGWAALALRSLQRVSLSAAAWEAGRQHMLDALAEIAPDLYREAAGLVTGAASWWERNSWWVVPAGVGLGGLAAFSYVRSFLPARGR